MTTILYHSFSTAFIQPNVRYTHKLCYVWLCKDKDRNVHVRTSNGYKQVSVWLKDTPCWSWCKWSLRLNNSESNNSCSVSGAMIAAWRGETRPMVTMMSENISDPEWCRSVLFSFPYSFACAILLPLFRT